MTPTHPDPETRHRAEALARVISPAAIVEWRPMSATALREHHRRPHWGLDGIDGIESAASAIATDDAGDDPPIEEWCADAVRRSWKSLLELHRLGVSVVLCGASVVVLAFVEEP